MKGNSGLDLRMGKMRKGHIEGALGKKYRSGHVVEGYKWCFPVRVDWCRTGESNELD